MLNSDAAYVVNTAADAARVNRARKGANGDLWSHLTRLNGARDTPVRILKVAAHAKPVDVLGGKVNVADFLGNHLADAAAGAAAERALDGNERARLVEMWQKRAFLIAKRLAAIESWHWQNAAGDLCAPPPPLPPWAPPVDEDVRAEVRNRVTANGHVLQKEGGKNICRRCHKRRNLKNHSYWLSTVCVPVTSGPAEAIGAPRRPRQGGSPVASGRGGGGVRRAMGAAGNDSNGGSSGSRGYGLSADGQMDCGKRRRVDAGGDGHERASEELKGDFTSGDTEHEIGYNVDGNYSLLTPIHGLGTCSKPGDADIGTPHADQDLRFNDLDEDSFEEGNGHQFTAAASSVPEGQWLDGHDEMDDDEPTVDTHLDSGNVTVGGYDLHFPGRVQGAYHPLVDEGTEAHYEGGNLGNGFQNYSSGIEGAPVAAAASSSDDQDVGRGAKRICTRSLDAGDGSSAEMQGATYPQGQSVDDVLMAQAADVEQEEDPFGFCGLDFDEGQVASSAAVGAVPHVDESGDNGQPPETLISARERRKMILSRAAERNKRKRAESEALTRAWCGGDAAVSVDNYLQLPPAQSAPPFSVHPTHSLVLCGGFTGCVRCGRVVAFQCHGRFNETCRGSCPTGSQRPIRRLVRGIFPHDVRQSHLAPPWPDGVLTPTPQRWRPP